MKDYIPGGKKAGQVNPKDLDLDVDEQPEVLNDDSNNNSKDNGDDSGDGSGDDNDHSDPIESPPTDRTSL